MSTKAPVRDIDLLRTWCLMNSLNFTRYFFKVRFKRKFVIGDHHIKIAKALDDVLSGKIKKLMINIAPRYGKTEIAVKNFIANGLAINPRAKFIHLSYSDDLVNDNSREVQSIMLEPEYQKLFAAKPTSTNARKWYTKEGGGLYAVSSAGQVTGFGAGLVDKEQSDEDKEEEEKDMDEFLSCLESEEFGGAIVIDDPIKPDDALSPVMREKVNQKFDTTIRNRVNSRNTPFVLIMQRVHENDLCGFLLANEPGEWTVLSLPCIYTDANGEEQSLWPFKHTLEELKKLKLVNPYVFDTQYMQDPKPMQGLMYEMGFKQYDTIPAGPRKRKAYTDTADEGSDYLCSIVYDEMPHASYIIDVIYTQKPMEYTEPVTAEQFTKHQVDEAMIESNNGGRGFARAVEKQCRLMGNHKTKIKWFHQGENKVVRIFTQSAAVQNLCIMPAGWDKLWPAFYKSVTSYMKIGTNDHDDAEDALTGIVEQRKKPGLSVSQISDMLPI
jgi:predicted phage terminase large subunit-like protein